MHSIENSYVFFQSIFSNVLQLFIVAGFISIVVITIDFLQQIFEGNTTGATIIGAFIALIGMVVSIAIQTQIKHKEILANQQKDRISKIVNDYEKIRVFLNRSRYVFIEETSAFIEKIDERVKIYASDEVLHLWTIKRKEKY
ncbi:hypothetical protein [Chroogloeocystis siderophila]|uniref:Uncharacterized protein n=1 Tax=Chroogloeocystis siderophila 5.2 s.c.1 TaxID=247279 RepID=A0A1U7HVY9_9CHRO|nr:hypothetical protein [Chroogloeocystis siderophila]OKH27768.1 hypothetical protein NIES1031_07585 [Chroogloeocystis siderophila 5.2 s.c.1]